MRRETKVIGQGTSDEVTEITRYEYDYNGNMTYKGKETIKPEDIDSQETFDAYLAGSKKDSQLAFYEYNGLNQLFRAMEEGKLIEYAYNAEGLRTNKTVNGVMTVHVWDGNNMVAELDEKGSLIAKYIRGINLIAADNYNGSSTTRQYYVYNGHGDVVLLTNSSGSVTKTYEYDAFGVEKNPDPNDINPFRYCGEYFDKETETYYLRARYYSPGIGRFISEDSYRGEINDPLSLNLYTYCYNNPIRYFDPTGHVVTAWDKLHCTPTEIDIISKASSDWIIGNATGNKSLMSSAHSRAEAIRNRYRVTGEYGGIDGNTWGKQGQYNTNLYFENQTISAAPKTNVIDFNVNYGTGLDVQLKINGIGVEIGGKRYYDLTNVASDNATESLQFSLMAQATDKVQVGGSVTGTINAITKEHLSNQGFAGVKIGNKVMGWDNLPNDKDFKFEYGVGAYIGVGGEASVTINVSELWRRIYKSFE